MSDKWGRMEVARFLADYADKSVRYVRNAILNEQEEYLNKLIEVIAESMANEIKNRNITFVPIKYSTRIDGNSGKVREIGIESIEQQIYNYAAVIGLRELFDRKIGEYQCASIPGRGQVYGKRALEKWIRKNPDKSRIAAKGDVQKCYPSIDRERLKRFLEKQVKNDDLLYLTFTLIDSYRQGLSIGSYLSQWLCNYFLSFAYHYASEDLFKTKKRRDGATERVRLITHIMFYLDDFILIGTRKADVRKAMKMLIIYMADVLGLVVKQDWILFQIDWLDDDGKHHGQCVDMMGYRVYRDRTEIRRGIFLKARCNYVKALNYIKRGQEIPLSLAYKCISYYGWFKNSDSMHFIKKYKVEQIIKTCKRRVSNESKSKIHRTTAAR